MEEIIPAADPRLQALARRLEALMKKAHGDEARAPLEYLLGALHGLFEAKTLGFKDRSHALDDARGRSAAGVEYWDYGPLRRVRLMTEGKLRIDGAWVAGFYFNSALVRIAAVFDRVVRRQAAAKGLHRAPHRGRPPSVRELLRRLGLGRFTSGTLANVYDEVNRLKHHAAGLARRRHVTMANATAAFEQMLDLLEHPNMQ
jgi:hypothetical protein